MLSTAGRIASALWLVALLGTLMAVALSHGAEGASTHVAHAPTPHHHAHSGDHGSAHAAEDGDEAAAACAASAEHAHAGCESVQAAPFQLLVLLAPIPPWWRGRRPSAAGARPDRLGPGGGPRRRRCPQLVSELSVMRV
ncbi:hypothetical protein [Nocardiopsis sp. YSL2]|uniref:hypothetical protein n=1 Tax=Nocardiopsis sp. YSL2 TaxID=2939492 RepID=UPI0026F45387|nr:hypothetical protein [Nocardiopsis sp. YSL2]